MSEVCGDNRFELIEEFKGKLVEGTNIETSPDEMAVLDNILFRFWQMGWLDKLKAQEPIEARLHLCDSCTKLYPECDATADGIEFGCGVGNDNIIGCTAYENRWKAQEPRVMTVSEIGALANGDVVWVEFTDGRLLPMMVEDGCLMRWRFLWRICEDAFYDDDYKARAWTSLPDQATREATPWGRLN